MSSTEEVSTKNHIFHFVKVAAEGDIVLPPKVTLSGKNNVLAGKTNFRGCTLLY